MIQRQSLQNLVRATLSRQAAVALIGPRQVGKTTLALELAKEMPSLYLDLETLSDRNKLSDPAFFLKHYEEHLVILDEIHRMPELFQPLRGLIDEGRRTGKRTGRFLILGSASLDLLRQSSESLAGRIAYLDMGTFNILEVNAPKNNFNSDLWVRGGFPDSYLAKTDNESLAWRKDFIRSYLEREVRMFGPARIPSETLERLWTMLAHGQGTLLNSSRLAESLMVSAQTTTRYIDLMVDLLLVRRLQPFYGNTKKRLVKSPKVYIRDSGMLHALLGIGNYNDLCGHPVSGASWEGFTIENLLSVSPAGTQASFYRTSGGSEMDLILETQHHGLLAIEIKQGGTPKAGKGFHAAIQEIQPDHAFVVYSGETRYPLAPGIEAIGLKELSLMLSSYG